jgi:hypothetical protein
MQCSHPLLQTQATMTGREHLHLYARLRGVHPAARRAAMVERLLTQVMLLDGVSVCSSAGGEQQSDATLQAARGWARPPCRHFKNQSLCCLGSASRRRLCTPSNNRVQGRVRSHQCMSLADECRGVRTQLGLRAYADRLAGSYSGGNRRKLSVGIALVGEYLNPIEFQDPIILGNQTEIPVALYRRRPRVRAAGRAVHRDGSGGKSSLGDAKSSLGDAKSSLGDAQSSPGDAKSSLGDAKSSLGDAQSLPG